jgi:predicted dehydrogenase
LITLTILGAGFMGSAHAANYDALGERVRVKWVASRTPERAAKLAESLGAQSTADLEAAVRDPEIDAVDICLPTPLHREAAESALAAGKHVFLEKPIAVTLEDADAIVAAAERSAGLFMVGLVLRFWRCT